MVQPDAYRHDESSVLFAVFSPVDDGSEEQMSVREFNIQGDSVIQGQRRVIRLFLPCRCREYFPAGNAAVIDIKIEVCLNLHNLI